MLIRFLDGSRKGEVCFVQPHTARHLCSIGMAVDVRQVVEEQEDTTSTDVAPAPTPPDEPDAPKPRGSKKAKRKRST